MNEYGPREPDLRVEATDIVEKFRAQYEQSNCGAADIIKYITHEYLYDEYVQRLKEGSDDASLVQFMSMGTYRGYSSVRRRNPALVQKVLGDYAKDTPDQTEFIERTDFIYGLVDEITRDDTESEHPLYYEQTELKTWMVGLYKDFLADDSKDCDVATLAKAYVRQLKSGVVADVSPAGLLLKGLVDKTSIKQSMAARRAGSWRELVEDLGIDLKARTPIAFMLQVRGELESGFWESRPRKYVNLLSYAHMPMVKENLPKFQDLEDELTYGVPTGGGKVIGAGIVLFDQYLMALRQHSAESNGAKLESLIKRIRDRKGVDARTYGDYVTAANIITKALPQSLVGSAGSLPTNSLQSLPAAFNRLLYFTDTDNGVSAQDADDRELFEVVSRSVNMLIETGVERKLDQKKYTLGDIALKYAHLSATEARGLLEAMKLRKWSVPINAVYHEIQAQK